MSAKEYIKMYISGQGGFESVSPNVALRAIDYAKQEAREEMMKDAVVAEITTPASSSFLQIRYKLPKDTDLKYGNKVKILILKNDEK